LGRTRVLMDGAQPPWVLHNSESVQTDERYNMGHPGHLDAGDLDLDDHGICSSMGGTIAHCHAGIGSLVLWLELLTPSGSHGCSRM
jgi:hypothetical protein